MNQPIPNNLYPFANGLTSSSPFIEHFDTRDPTPQDTQFQVQQRWWNKTLRNEWVLTGFTSASGIVLAIWEPVSSSTTVETLQGNTGGPVGPDGSNNIHVIGDTTTITIAGNPGTNTLTASTTGAVATSYVEDAGTAVPILGVLHINGAGGITTSGATNVVTITAGPTMATTYTEDTGTATPAANNLNVFGGTAGRDINTSGSGSTIHIDLNNAITVGDLSVLGPGVPSITMTSGDLFINGGTGSSATNPKIVFGPTNNLISFFLNSVFMGSSAGNTTGSGVFNIGIGPSALSSYTTGQVDTAIGNGALQHCTTGSNNSAIGFQTLNLLTTGSDNTVLGAGSLPSLLTGSNNNVFGNGSAGAYVGAESNNIIMGDAVNGTAAESNVLRIGAATGGGAGQLNKAFISGIRGITTGNADAVAVLVDSANQLGTISSSVKVKHEIEDMGQKSDAIWKLRPVKFKFIEDRTQKEQVGLIAEEVKEICPSLVANDQDGNPWSVKYHELPVMLLNELQKLQRRVEFLEWQVKDR